MDRHHSLGFKQFAGRGLRQIAVWQGHWLTLLSGHRSVPFRRLHRIGNQTRFLVLPAASGIANRASRILGQSLQRRSGDWWARHGHRLDLAEACAGEVGRLVGPVVQEELRALGAWRDPDSGRWVTPATPSRPSPTSASTCAPATP